MLSFRQRIIGAVGGLTIAVSLGTVLRPIAIAGFFVGVVIIVWACVKDDAEYRDDDEGDEE